MRKFYQYSIIPEPIIQGDLIHHENHLDNVFCSLMEFFHIPYSDLMEMPADVVLRMHKWAAKESKKRAKDIKKGR